VFKESLACQKNAASEEKNDINVLQNRAITQIFLSGACQSPESETYQT
jgi:hypothetical protein